ncbi:ABC transporter, ATP-binding protein [Dictyocaulus viviparus]|uniref:ABC transporter, ATP-binding protein n=1 Tax=Dictyocaulus viviparus TaxID=29172 RepID=A0A0D8Y7Q3_DICVI|nr:ABC transporter, ATP-binding protein [Dictyocaulus viviparus]
MCFIFSGAGKTTLMNTLLHRNLSGLDVDGEILVNGQNIGNGVTSVSAYVQQEDLFVGTLTVREHLMIQAKMKLPSTFTKDMRIAKVEEVIKDMLLEGPQSSRIGVPGIVKGISGGEMKRLSFATEMLSNPQILFCDEPTTGLDSHMAEVVVKTLDSLAGEKGKTVICTIHQPSSEVFEIFDKVVFLAQGRVAFHGPPDEAVWFFAECGYILPDHMNPADHFIDTLAIWPDSEEECKIRANEICNKFAISKYASELNAQMKEAEKPRSLCSHRGARFPDLVSALFLRLKRQF